jgi:catechol 2,3-dioxygenase-like lactoylglutathione lyase family enzyme
MADNSGPLHGSKMLYVFVYVSDLEASRAFYETTLGLRVIEDDAGAVKFDAGEIIIALNRKSDAQTRVKNGPDDTSIFVFHVDDIDAMRSALATRGVEFSGPTVRYDIGATATFYDPDGHCFGLYEASRLALMWPSADRIRAIIARTSPQGDPISTRGLAAAEGDSLSLRSRKMIYLFLFVKDTAESRRFYAEALGLPIVEAAPDGTVVKYDTGGVMLATHLVACEEGARALPEDLDRPRSIAPVFSASNVSSVFEALSSRQVPFLMPPSESEIGTTAKFQDPSGHVFFIYEPSARALGWPSGRKIEALVNQHA